MQPETCVYHCTLTYTHEGQQFSTVRIIIMASADVTDACAAAKAELAGKSLPARTRDGADTTVVPKDLKVNQASKVWSTTDQVINLLK